MGQILSTGISTALYRGDMGEDDAVRTFDKKFAAQIAAIERAPVQFLEELLSNSWYHPDEDLDLGEPPDRVLRRFESARINVASDARVLIWSRFTDVLGMDIAQRFAILAARDLAYLSWLQLTRTVFDWRVRVRRLRHQVGSARPKTDQSALRMAQVSGVEIEARHAALAAAIRNADTLIASSARTHRRADRRRLAGSARGVLLVASLYALLRLGVFGGVAGLVSSGGVPASGWPQWVQLVRRWSGWRGHCRYGLHSAGSEAPANQHRRVGRQGVG